MAEILANINWIEVVGYVVMLLIGGAATYIKTNPKLLKEVTDAEKWIETIKADAVVYIDRAEREFSGTGRGEAKFVWVVNALYNLIPVKIRPFIAKKTVEDIVQSVFDMVDDYARQQLDRIVDEVLPDEEA